MKTEKIRDDIAKDVEIADRSLRLYNVRQTFTEDNNTLKNMIDAELNDDLAKNALRGASIHPLSKSLNEGTRPVAVTFVSAEKKSDFEKIIKARTDKTRTSYLWPKYLHKDMEKYRTNLQTYSDDDIDLRDKLVMLRPTKDGRKISIKYKAKTAGAKWANFKLFDIPIPEDKVKKDKLIQVNIPGFIKKKKSPNQPRNESTIPEGAPMLDPTGTEPVVMDQ